MAVFAVQYTYSPDTETRMQVRPQHRTWLSRLFDEKVILAAGPYEENRPGALLLVHAASQPAVEDVITQDPYAEAGVIEGVEIRQWTPVFGPWVQD